MGKDDLQSNGVQTGGGQHPSSPHSILGGRDTKLWLLFEVGWDQPLPVPRGSNSKEKHKMNYRGV